MRQSDFTGIAPANDNRSKLPQTPDMFPRPPSMGIDFGSGDQTSLTLHVPGGRLEIIHEDDPRFMEFLSLAVAP